MDTWKFYDITHREHVVCNPTSEEKLARLVALLRLPTNAQVADIACGKGEFLLLLAEAYGVRGMGVDISFFHVPDAKKRLKARAPGSGISFAQMNGADFKPEEPHSLDLASCIGAGWVLGEHADTLEALSSMVKPGGWVIVGEPYWLREPHNRIDSRQRLALAQGAAQHDSRTSRIYQKIMYTGKKEMKEISMQTKRLILNNLNKNDAENLFKLHNLGQITEFLPDRFKTISKI